MKLLWLPNGLLTFAARALACNVQVFFARGGEA